MKGIEPVQSVGYTADKIRIDCKNVCRYLGIRTQQPDAALKERIISCISEFRAAARFRAAFRIMPARITAEGVDFGAFLAPGNNLRKHFAGCDRALLFAATAGGQIDLQRKRVAVCSPSRALVLDAIGTAAVESFCDMLCGKWAEEWDLRPRFSPGYGDLPLAVQKPLLTVLDANRKAGIALTDALLMIPQKSVSAIVGIRKTENLPGPPEKVGCEGCDQPECAFRQ